jgi:hypothetical protein
MDRSPLPRPCDLCHQPAILRSSRGKPCHWTCAVAWVNEHQDHDQEPTHARCTLVDAGPPPGLTLGEVRAPVMPPMSHQQPTITNSSNI